MLPWLQYFREIRICRDIHGLMMGVSIFILVIFSNNSFILHQNLTSCFLFFLSFFPPRGKGVLWFCFLKDSCQYGIWDSTSELCVLGYIKIHRSRGITQDCNRVEASGLDSWSEPPFPQRKPLSSEQQPPCFCDCLSGLLELYRTHKCSRVNQSIGLQLL